MQYKTISYAIDDKGLALISLAPPDAENRTQQAAIRELCDLLSWAELSEDVKVIILHCEKWAFSSGLAPEFLRRIPMDAADLSLCAKEFDQFTVLLAGMSKPIVATVNSPSAGMNLMVALAADMTVAAEQAMFSAVFGKAGVLPTVAATYLLPRLVGPVKAREILFTRPTLDISEALRLGLIWQSARPEELLNIACSLAEQMAQPSALSLRLTKQMISHCYEVPLQAAADMGALSQVLASDFCEEEQEEIPCCTSSAT